MKRNVSVRLLLSLALLGLSVYAAFAQKPAKAPKPPAEDSGAAWFLDPEVFNASLLLEPPPAADSVSTKADLAELHRLQETRTPAQVAAAQADDAEEDIFSYATVLGSGFAAAKLPVTAAFSAHVHNDEGVASLPLKTLMHRPRPYQADPTLHPVCKVTDKPNSYPSGHSISGYLEAFALIQMVPERRDAILTRADDYVNNRMICGVHYRTDTQASRRVALVAFGYMLATPRFQKELAAATVETRNALGLAPLASR